MSQLATSKPEAQAELSAYIEAQAQEIAPEPEIQFIDLDNFYNYEAQAAGEVITPRTPYHA